jgi:hypothetical protein
VFVECPCLGRGCRVGVRRPAPFPRVPVECELGDDEDATLLVQDGPVHFTIGVDEYAQVDDLVAHVAGVALRIALPDAEVHQEPLIDVTGEIASDLDRAVADPLDNRAHGRLMGWEADGAKSRPG